MDLSDFFEMIITDHLIEVLGLLFLIGLLDGLIFGDTANELLTLLIGTLC